MALQGAREWRARVKATKTVFKSSGRDWAEATATEAKRRVAPYRATGKTQDSIRRKNASQRKATVVGWYPVNFIDAGTKEHDIKPRRAKILAFKDAGHTVFARKVHKRAQPAHPFKQASAQAGLRKVNIIGHLIDLWNGAA